MGSLLRETAPLARWDQQQEEKQPAYRIVRNDLDESDIMLDPWVELPTPSGGIIVVARPGELPPPDLPEIPPDWEDS